MAYKPHFMKEKKSSNYSSFQDFLSIIGSFLKCFAMFFGGMLLVTGVFFVMEIGLSRLSLKKLFLYGSAVILVLYLFFRIAQRFKKPRNKQEVYSTNYWSDQKNMLEANCNSMTEYWLQLPMKAELYSQLVENINLYAYCQYKYADDETKERQSSTQMHDIYKDIFNYNEMVEKLFAIIDPELYSITLLQDLLLCGLFDEFDIALTAIQNNQKAVRINENYEAFLADVINTTLEEGIFSHAPSLFYAIQERSYLLTSDALHTEFITNCQDTERKMYESLSFQIWDRIDHNASEGIELWKKVLKENMTYLSNRAVAEMLIDEVLNSSFYDPDEVSTVEAYKAFLNQPELAEKVVTGCVEMDDPLGYLVLFARKQNPGSIQVTGEEILSFAKRNHHVSNGREALQKIIGYLVEEDTKEGQRW